VEKSCTKRTLLQKWRRIIFLSKGMTLAEYRERNDTQFQMEDLMLRSFMKHFLVFNINIHTHIAFN